MSHNKLGNGNVAPYDHVFGKEKVQTLREIEAWVAEGGEPYAITLTPNSVRASGTHILSKLKRFAAELAHQERGVPRCCPLTRMKSDRPRIVGFLESQTIKDAPIVHFHGLIALRGDNEVEFCHSFFGDHWSGRRDLLTENARTFELADPRTHSGQALGWIRYSAKYQGLGLPCEPIFIG